MPKKLDKQTEKIFTQGELLKSLVENKGWAVAKTKLLKKVASLLNMADISVIDPAHIALLIGIRQETAKALLEWMKEIEGEVSQHKANLSAFQEVPDSFLINLEDLEEKA